MGIALHQLQGRVLMIIIFQSGDDVATGLIQLLSASNIPLLYPESLYGVTLFMAVGHLWYRSSQYMNGILQLVLLPFLNGITEGFSE